MAILYAIPLYLLILTFFYFYLFTKFNISINPPSIREQKFDYSLLMSKYETFDVIEKSNNQLQTNISNIQLIGTAVGFKNLAIIKLEGKTHIVSQGQNLNGIKIINIGKDFILVGYGGKTQKITFKTQTKQTTSDKSQPADLPPLDKLLGNNTIPKSEIEKLTADPGVMLTQIRLIPVVENGQTKGFRFDWIQEASLFQRMGIQVGDILVAINNQKINSGEDAFRILQMLRNESSIKITILRNGQIMDMNYFIN